MISAELQQWREHLLAKLRTRRLLFLQLGSGDEPARRALAGVDVEIVTPVEYLHEDSDRNDSAIVIIRDLERLTVPTHSPRMGELREAVFNGIDRGQSVVLLSRAPRIAFPEVPGSSLLDDAVFAHAPQTLISDYQHLPSCAEDLEDPDVVLNRIVDELGPALRGSLDFVLFEARLVGSEALELLSAREVEALDGAGLTALEAGGRSWRFSRHLAPLRRSLEEAISTDLTPQPQLEVVTRLLWVIERAIRARVRRQAVLTWGDKWRTQCLNEDQASRVVSRASESAYLGVGTVKDVRDPLEWLTVGELLEFTDRREIGPLGLTPSIWRQFKLQVLPIRNQLAHMRNLRPTDHATVVKWARIVTEKLA